MENIIYISFGGWIHKASKRKGAHPKMNRIPPVVPAQTINRGNFSFGISPPIRPKRSEIKFLKMLLSMSKSILMVIGDGK
jgi:hypothetical protein